MYTIYIYLYHILIFVFPLYIYCTSMNVCVLDSGITEAFVLQKMKETAEARLLAMGVSRMSVTISFCGVSSSWHQKTKQHARDSPKASGLMW